MLCVTARVTVDTKENQNERKPTLFSTVAGSLAPLLATQWLKDTGSWLWRPRQRWGRPLHRISEKA